VADDSLDNVEIVTAFLEKWNAEVETAGNGETVLLKLSQKHYDLILMDLQMPVLDGYETTAAIRSLQNEEKRRIPIIAFSASTKLGQPDKAELFAFSGILSKPFSPAELFQKVFKVLNS
jgi:CheY-like chemotaxis protein